MGKGKSDKIVSSTEASAPSGMDQYVKIAKEFVTQKVSEDPNMDKGIKGEVICMSGMSHSPDVRSPFDNWVMNNLLHRA